MALIESEMPVNKIGKLVKVPEKLGIDETSRRKGHDYIINGVLMGLTIRSN